VEKLVRQFAAPEQLADEVAPFGPAVAFAETDTPPPPSPPPPEPDAQARPALCTTEPSGPGPS
jgi:hypothetical protein